MDSIKRIKNLRYSKSQGQNNIRRAELGSELKAMLLDTDWTQLPDTIMSPSIKCKWAVWRDGVRSIMDSDKLTLSELEKGLVNLRKVMDEMPDNYTEFDTIEEGKEYLHTLLVTKYNLKINSRFSPTLDAKYNEILDLISEYVSTHDEHTIMSTLNTGELMEYIKSMPDMDIELDSYPLLKLTVEIYGGSLNGVVSGILQDKADRMELILQEEYTMLHYGRLISSCSSMESIADVAVEIEMHYSI